MTEPQTDRLKQIRERWDAATPGPWAWFGAKKYQDLYLATVGRGRIFVMQFQRWGMQRAQPVFQVHDRCVREGRETCRGCGIMTPATELVETTGYSEERILGVNNPDAQAIASAPSDVAWLLGEVERLRAALDDISDGCHCTKPDPWAIGQCDCQTDTARAALEAAQ